MAGTITDHLASASGPMTGSGSALNQLGYAGQHSSYYYGGGGGATGLYPAGEPSLAANGLGSQAGAPPPPLPIHSGRYEGQGYARASSGQRHGQQAAAGSTTAGAYHLERPLEEPMQAPLAMPMQIRADPRYYGAQSLHQSLGNLPSASSRLEQRYALQEAHAHADRYLGHEPMGLGGYNPLEDPLAGHQLHLRQQHADPLGPSAHFGPVGGGGGGGASSRDAYVTELRARLQEAQNNYVAVKRELESATQKLGSSMHSIKSFWSPELKKERALRKEEATKYALINDQMKLMRVEVQVSHSV